MDEVLGKCTALAREISGLIIGETDSKMPQPPVGIPSRGSFLVCRLAQPSIFVHIFSSDLQGQDPRRTGKSSTAIQEKFPQTVQASHEKYDEVNGRKAQIVVAGCCGLYMALWHGHRGSPRHFGQTLICYWEDAPKA